MVTGRNSGRNCRGVPGSQKGQLPTKLASHDYDIRNIAFSPNDRFVVSASAGPVVMGQPGEMVMIIDACQFAGATGHSFKPGPMGIRSPGQLGYNKRIRILAAGLVTQSAPEVGGMIGHGLLSYSLLTEGLDRGLADRLTARSRSANGCPAAISRCRFWHSESVMECSGCH